MQRPVSLKVRSRGWFRCALLLATCATGWAVPSTAEVPAIASPNTVILISLDGTRPADLGDETLPSLVALAKRGAIAQGLVPSTPSNTFPSHVTLVTGVEPNEHGMVNNFFIDEERGAFRKRDIPSWIEVEPLWSLLADRGIVSASFHWVGSEGPWRSGRGPKHWEPFSSSTPSRVKVEKILGWLDLGDPAERPRLITSWFPGADHAAHLAGPGTASAVKQLAQQEPAFAALIDGIEARGLWPSTTLIVVSDHGMVAADALLDFDLVLRDAGVRARVTGMGGFASVYLDERERGPSGSAELAIAKVAALAHEAGLEAIVVGRPEAGPRFSHPRFGDLVLRAPIGTAIHRPGLPKGGFHGYRSAEPQMHGIFVAAGRGVSPELELSLLQATDIAPTVLGLLGVAAPEWMNGSEIVLESAGSKQ